MDDLIEQQKKQLVPLAEAKVPAVLSGVGEELLDGNLHVGVAIDVAASGKPSTLMLPDVTGVKSGKSPIFITKPIEIEGKNFTEFLTAKSITLPEQAKNLIADTTIGLNAFYFVNDRVEPEYEVVEGKKVPKKDINGKEITKKIKDGAFMMSVDAKFEQGLITSLTGDESLGKLFEVKKISLRVLRCTKDEFPTLQAYAKELES
jgi:hypothetical protein